MVGVSTGDRAKLLKAKKRRRIAHTLVLDADDKVMSAYEVKSVPRLFLVDPAGVIRFVEDGGPTQQPTWDHIGKLVHAVP